eukprot:1366270-Rhodomonas_salina.1
MLHNPFSVQFVPCAGSLLGIDFAGAACDPPCYAAKSDATEFNLRTIVFYSAMCAMCDTDTAHQTEIFGPLVFGSDSVTDINVSYPPTRLLCDVRY